MPRSRAAAHCGLGKRCLVFPAAGGVNFRCYKASRGFFDSARMATAGRTPTATSRTVSSTAQEGRFFNEGRVARTALTEVPMHVESPSPELRRSRDRLAGARSRKTGQDVRVRSVAIPRPHIGGDTDALDWRSDPRLLAIRARGVNRE